MKFKGNISKEILQDRVDQYWFRGYHDKMGIQATNKDKPKSV